MIITIRRLLCSALVIVCSISLCTCMWAPGNDSEMDVLRYIKNTYVVSNAKEIKKLAINKTKSNNAKGSENVIKKIS